VILVGAQRRRVTALAPRLDARSAGGLQLADLEIVPGAIEQVQFAVGAHGMVLAARGLRHRSRAPKIIWTGGADRHRAGMRRRWVSTVPGQLVVTAPERRPSRRLARAAATLRWTPATRVRSYPVRGP